MKKRVQTFDFWLCIYFCCYFRKCTFPLYFQLMPLFSRVVSYLIGSYKETEIILYSLINCNLACRWTSQKVTVLLHRSHAFTSHIFAARPYTHYFVYIHGG